MNLVIMIHEEGEIWFSASGLLVVVLNELQCNGNGNIRILVSECQSCLF